MLTPYAWLQPDNSRLVVGMSDGTLDIRQRVVKVGETVARQQQVRAMHGGSYRYFMRGKSSAADASDYKVCGMPCGLHDSANDPDNCGCRCKYNANRSSSPTTLF